MAGLDPRGKGVGKTTATGELRTFEATSECSLVGGLGLVLSKVEAECLPQIVMD